MGEVIGINRKRLFALSEARELLPVVQRVTRAAHDRVQLLAQRLELGPQGDREALEAEIRDVFDEWQRKITGLGCEAKGVWLVDFDSGEGYYCWRHPEKALEYFHGYDEGFRGRKLMQ